jgi:hypothetical protein
LKSRRKYFCEDYQVDIFPFAISGVQPGVQMGMVGTGVSVQTMSMNSANMQQRADQAFGGLGSFN